MVSQAHVARLNSAPLISLSASSLQANIYQLIGLKAAPLGGSAFWRQLNMARATGCDVVRFETKAGRSPSSTLPFSGARSGVFKKNKLLIFACAHKEQRVVTGTHDSEQSLLNP